MSYIHALDDAVELFDNDEYADAKIVIHAGSENDGLVINAHRFVLERCAYFEPYFKDYGGGRSMLWKETIAGTIELHGDPPQALIACLAFQYTYKYGISDILGLETDQSTILRFHIDVAVITDKYGWKDLEQVVANDLWTCMFQMPPDIIVSAADYFMSKGKRPPSVADVFRRLVHFDAKPITFHHCKRNELMNRYQSMRKIPDYEIPEVKECYENYWNNNHLADVKFRVQRGSRIFHVIPLPAEVAGNTLDPDAVPYEIWYLHRGIMAKSCAFLHDLLKGHNVAKEFYSPILYTRLMFLLKFVYFLRYSGEEAAQLGGGGESPTFLDVLRGHVRAYEIGERMGVRKLMLYSAGWVGQFASSPEGRQCLREIAREFLNLPRDHPVGMHIQYALWYVEGPYRPRN